MIRFQSISATLIIAVLWLGCAGAQDKALKKISWGVTSLSASNWIP